MLHWTSQEYPHFPGYPTAILISGGILFYGSPFKPVDPLNVSYFYFRLVSKLQTSQRCQCSHPVQIHDSNHTPCIFLWAFIVTALGQWSLLQYWARKELHWHKWKSYMARRPLSKPVGAKEERNGPHSADQGLSTANPRSSHAVCSFECIHPPPRVPPFLLQKTLCQVTSQAESYTMHICIYHVLLVNQHTEI